MKDVIQIDISHTRIVNNFSVLLRKKEWNENNGNRLTFREISQITGLATSTLVAYSKQKINRYDESTLLALCAYFGCEIQDLIRIEKIPEEVPEKI